ncbi:hypothetical protein DIPPA_34660, partial [Diplonema papillatum]
PSAAPPPPPARSHPSTTIRGSTHVQLANALPLLYSPPLPPDEPEPKRNVWTEGSHHGMALFDPNFGEYRVRDPIIAARGVDGNLVVSGGDGLGITNFADALLTIHFSHGYTEHDFILFKSDLSDRSPTAVALKGASPSQRLQNMLLPGGLVYTESDRTIRAGAVLVATVTSGILLQKIPAKGGDVLKRWKRVEPSSTVELTLGDDPRLSGVVIHRLLERLRYHNTTRDPVPGKRAVDVSVKLPAGGFSKVTVEFTVDVHDDPVELTLDKTNLCFHAGCSSVTEDLRPLIQHLPLPIFRNAVLDDPDTDRFIGGEIRVTCTQMQRSDTLSLDPRCFPAEPADLEGALGQTAFLYGQDAICVYPWPPYTVFYQGEAIGHAACAPVDDDATARKRVQSLMKKAVPAGKRASSSASAKSPSKLFDVTGLLLKEKRNQQQQQQQQQQQPPGSPTGLSMSVSGAGTPAAVAPQNGRPDVFELRLDLADSCLAASPGTPGSPRRPPSPTDENDIRKKSLKEIRVVFTTDGAASVEGVQALLRCFTFRNPLPNVSTAHVRVVELFIQLGATVPTHGAAYVPTPPESLPAVNASATIKATPALLSVSSKFSLLQYNKGAGPKRLASFEVIHEQYVDKYNEGFIWVEFATGFVSTEDVLWLREADGLSFSELPTFDPETGDSSKTVAGILDQLNADKRKNSGALSRLRKTAQTAWRRKSRRMTIQPDQVTAVIYEVFLDGRLIAHATFDATTGRLSIHFAKESVIKRKDVTILLRNVTYNNTNALDPSLVQRRLRATLNAGSWSSSQAFVDISVRWTNNVAVIRLKADKVKYRPSADDAVLPFCIAPLHTVALIDDDTSCFSAGGTLSVELASGGGKGDQFLLLTRDQQTTQIDRQQRLASSKSASVSVSSHQSRAALNAVELTPRIPPIPDPETHLYTLDAVRKTLVFDSGAVATYASGRSSTGAFDLKVFFAASTPYITLAQATYLMSCVAFQSTGDRVREGMRACQFRLSDGLNDCDAREKILIDVRPPLLSLLSSANAVLEPEASGYPLARISVSQTEAALFPQGHLSIALDNGLPSDSLSVNFEKLAGSKDPVILKDDQLFAPSEGVLGTVAKSAAKLVFGFLPTGKARPVHLASFLKCVQVTIVPSPQVRKVVVTLSDGGPRVSRVTLSTA